jgi:hypothetical protein
MEATMETTGIPTGGQIKATAVVPTMEYVMFKHGKEVYKRVLDRLNPAQQNLFRKRMDMNDWIDLADFIALSRAIIAELYQGKVAMGEELGRASSEYGMSAFLKVFIQIGNVGFFVRKATSVFATYYRPARMILKDNYPTNASVQVIGLFDEDDIMKYRISGFIRNLVEKSGCKNVKLRFETDPTNGSFMIYCSWD